MTALDWLKKIFGCKEEYWKQEANRLYGISQEYDAENKSLKVVIYQQTKDINDLKSLIVVDNSICPMWLDERYMPYIPSVSLPEGTVALDNPREIYTSNLELKNMILKETKGMTSDQKILWAWYKVIDCLTYMYDVTDDWQFPIVTWEKLQGDCEDGTVLFVELCKLAGISADSVFNACGWYKVGDKQFGHSFPIARMADNKWYIFETTLDYHPSGPILFEGSNYDDSWGDCNWKYAGKRKTSAIEQQTITSTGLNFENALYDDLDEKAAQEKIKSINAYWKKQRKGR
jgi:transglutaminase-like putative cysteine protease